MEGSEMTKAYVTADGHFGGDEVLIFDSHKLSDKQWENLSFINDGDRLGYAVAILDDDPEEVAKYERYL
jgi:hypothetical protein